MKEIPLTQGYVALVDDEDYELVADRTWCPAPRDDRIYSINYKRARGQRRTCTLMHRLILDAPRGVRVDHVNGNGLDNRRGNLRFATPGQNTTNARTLRGLSFFKGVSWREERRRWRAYIEHEGRCHHLGYFEREEDAGHAYDEAARKHFGTYAALNFPRPGEQSAHRVPEIGAPMPAVTLSGTFGKNERPSNGLEEIADELVKDQLKRHYVVGVVQFAGATVPGPNEELVPRVKFLAIEPLSGEAAEGVQRVLDGARKARGLGIVDDIPAATGEMAGQDSLFDFGDPDEDADEPVDVNASGEPVPPPSGEELTAELDERRAKRAKAPAAKFTGGGDA